MTNLRRPGHIVFTLRPGERFAGVASHVDYVAGAGRRSSRLDDGPIDRALRQWGDGFRALSVYHARRSLGSVGQHHVGFDHIEESLGLSRTYRVEIGDPARTHDAVAALRDQPLVESAGVQMLATVPFAAAAPERTDAASARREAWEQRERIRLREALAMEPGDERVTVAIVDTGVSLGHPELQRKLLAGYNTVELGMGALNDQIKLVGDSRGRDFTPADDVGHGSHCAGEIGAHGWRLPPGAAGYALMLPVRVLAAAVDERGRKSGVGALPDIDAGIKVAVDLGADVLNLSLGTPSSAVDPHGPKPHEAVAAYADHYGCILVAAAGNSGVEEPFYPAALPIVIAVGSVDSQGRRSRFSTWGKHLALCAPGERILSIGRHGYRRSSGTSHAAPFVSGVAALLVAHARRRGRGLSGADARRFLTEAAAPLGAAGFDPQTGHGSLDAAAALQRLDRAISGGMS